MLALRTTFYAIAAGYCQRQAKRHASKAAVWQERQREFERRRRECIASEAVVRAHSHDDCL